MELIDINWLIIIIAIVSMTTVSIYITDRGKGAYMFYDTTSNTGLLAISNIYSDSKYQERVSL